jgi:hypothetical protein
MLRNSTTNTTGHTQRGFLGIGCPLCTSSSCALAPWMESFGSMNSQVKDFNSPQDILQQYEKYKHKTTLIIIMQSAADSNRAKCDYSPRLWVCVRYANGCKTFFSLIMQDVSIFSTDMGWMLPPVPNRSTPASFSSLPTWQTYEKENAKETDHMQMGYAAIHILLLS